MPVERSAAEETRNREAGYSQEARASQDPIARAVEQADWIKPGVEIAAQKAILRPFHAAGTTGAKVLSFLHGHWLHEPLHVVLTDVPVGAWTVTVIADELAALTKREGLNSAADVALLIGLVGATGAAVTGMADWSEIKAEAPRRVGAAHALLNVAATGLMVGSYVTRRVRRRTLARSLALGAYVLVSLSAHLGGNLIYEHGIGVRKPGD